MKGKKLANPNGATGAVGVFVLGIYGWVLWATWNAAISPILELKGMNPLQAMLLAVPMWTTCRLTEFAKD